MVTKQIKHKTEDGKEVVLDLGALAKNVTEDEERRFVSDTEKTDWNAKLDGDGNGSNLEAVFTQAESRSNLTSGEKHSTIFGKIAKWFADLKNHAFADLIQNATTADTTRAVSAAVAKNLQDQVNQLNTDIVYSEYVQKYIGASNTDIITTWVQPGIHILLADYSFSATSEDRTDTLQIYDYTKGSTIGFSSVLKNNSVHKGTLVKCVDIPKSDGAHQIGVQASQDGTVSTSFGVQFSVLTLKSY